MGKKKKNQEKKRKKRKALISPESLPVLLNNIKLVIEQKRGRRAIALAKHLVKHEEFQMQEHLPVFIAAYQVRITEMLNVLQLKEARALYTDIVKKYSDSTDLFSMEFLVKMDMESDSGAVLLKYGHDDKVTLAVNQYIINELKDIRILLENTSMFGHISLKGDAELIVAAWEEVEDASGKRTSYELMLKKINRHSPFIYWRLFIQALNMFYEFKDDKARKILLRIPHECSVFKMAAAMIMLIDNQPLTTEKGENIESRLEGKSLYSEIAGIDRMIDAGKWAAVDKALETIISANVYGPKSGFFVELGSLFLNKMYNFSSYNSTFLLKKDYFIYMNIHIFHLLEPDTGLTFLKKVLTVSNTRFGNIEKALIHQQIGDLSLELSNNMSQPISSFLPKFLSDAIGIGMDKNENFVDEITTSYGESIQHYPLSETYRKWYQVCQDFKVKIRESEQVLKQWQETFPDDESPLLEQVKACRFRKAFVKAMTNFRKLEKIAGGHPEVEKLRPYLLLDLIFRSIKENQLQKAQSFIPDCSMLGNKSVFVHAALKTFEFILASKQLASKQSAEESLEFKKNLRQLTELKQPVIIRSIIWCISETTTTCMTLKIPESIQKQEKDINLLLDSLYQFLIINDSLWKNQLESYILFVVPDELPDKLAVSSDRLLTCLKFLNKKDIYFANKNMWLFYWMITSSGIEADDELTYLFLAYRGFLYDVDSFSSASNKQVLMLEQYEEECFEAACHLAHNSADPNACEKLNAILILFDEDVIDYESSYSEKFVRSVISREAKQKTKFSFKKKKINKKKTSLKSKLIKFKLF